MSRSCISRHRITSSALSRKQLSAGKAHTNLSEPNSKRADQDFEQSYPAKSTSTYTTLYTTTWLLLGTQRPSVFRILPLTRSELSVLLPCLTSTLQLCCLLPLCLHRDWGSGEDLGDASHGRSAKSTVTLSYNRLWVPDKNRNHQQRRFMSVGSMPIQALRIRPKPVPETLALDP